MRGPSTLAIIFVLYGSYEDFDRFLQSQVSESEDVHLVLVDNTPHSEVRHNVLARWENIYGIRVCIAEPENRGYFGGAEQALDRFPELLECDYIAISNTDVIYQVNDVVHTLRNVQHDLGKVGAIAPRLVGKDGQTKAQPHYVNRPTVKKYERLAKLTSHYFLAAAHRLGSDLKRKAGFTRGGKHIPRSIFAPHGAFMIMSNIYFRQTAGFKHLCFLFNEEILVGSECEKAGLRCVYEPRITYSHSNHGSMGYFPSRKVIKLLNEAHYAAIRMLSQPH